MASKENTVARVGTLRLRPGADMPVLTGSLPPDFNRADIGRLSAHAFDLISKLTGHPCLSGRFRFEIEDVFVNRAISVDLVADKLIVG
ncbi:UNVERIFIED_ORG: hypothetical protein LHJ69_20385 [Shinella sp. XGS7]|nr:hypothetical protein [Shinella sp. XGS7]